ncbi:hypothetical protein GJ496_004841 [Pomphorhynchus laevis]|nr:hypothetical protein GJ496_004841 [Pomphorhynchus laevis]
MISDQFDTLISAKSSSEENLLMKLYRISFAQYETDELLEQFDQIFTMLLDQLQDSEKQVDYVEWLNEERFVWRIMRALCNRWQKQRHVQENVSSDDETAKSRISWFCSLIENEYLPTSNSLSAKYYHLFQQPCDWPETLFAAKKPKFDGRIISSLHPDAPFNGSSLALRDQFVDDKLLEVAFAYLRSGQIQQSIDLFESIGQFWRAAVLLSNDCHFVNKEDKELCFKTNSTLAFQECLSLHERAINGLLAGEVEVVWLVCKNIEDYWWAAAKCFLQSWDASGKGHKTLSNVFDIVRDKAPVKIVQRSRLPMRIMQQLLTLEEVEDAIEVLSNFMTNWSPSDGFQFHLYRFVVHISIVLLRNAPSQFIKHKYDRIDDILASFCKYISQFPNISILTVSYISLIRNVEVRRDCLVQVMQSVSSFDENMQIVESSISILTSTDVFNAVTRFLKEKRNQFTLDFHSIGSQIDEELIKELDLLLMLSNASEHVLAHGNALCRLCIALDDEESLSEIITCVESYENWQDAKSFELLEEHEDIVEYSTFQNALNRWLVITGTEAKSSHVCRIVADEINKSATRILKRDWMNCHLKSSITEIDQCRRTQIEEIRKLCIPKLMTTVIIILEKGEMYSELTEFIGCIVQPIDSVCKLLTSEQIKMILDAVCNASKYFLCNGNEAFFTS